VRVGGIFERGKKGEGGGEGPMKNVKPGAHCPWALTLLSFDFKAVCLVSLILTDNMFSIDEDIFLHCDNHLVFCAAENFFFFDFFSA